MMRILSKRNLAAIATIALSFYLATPVYAQSAADCAARAERAERGSSGVMSGAAVGTVGGAAFGAIVCVQRPGLTEVPVTIGRHHADAVAALPLSAPRGASAVALPNCSLHCAKHLL